MTRTDVLALEGRELDAAVAEKVMGWDIRKDQTGMSFVLHEQVYEISGLSIIWSQRDEYYRIIEGVEKVFPRAEMVSRYSSDRNAVALVLAEIERRGLNTAFLDELEDILWPDPIDLSEGDAAMGYLNAPPDAICKAALLAVLPEGGE